MNIEVVNVCDRIRLFIPVLGMVRDVTRKHHINEIVKTLELAIFLRFVHLREVSRYTKNRARVLVKLACNL